MTTPTSNPRPRAVADQDETVVAHAGNGVAPAVEPGARTNGSAGGATGDAAGGTGLVAAPAPPPAPTASATTAQAPTGAAVHRAAGPAQVGGLPSDPETVPKQWAQARGRRKRLLLLIPILLTALCVASLLAYRYWYQTTYFVSTENASVTGDLVQVGSLNAGRIVATRVDVGRPVREGQEIAVVAMPQEVGSGMAGAAPRMGITGNSDSLVPVYSPLNGIVAARMGHVGGTVTAGQPIYSLVDPRQVWIRANVEEASAWRVEVGQVAYIHADALNRDFVGQVDAITPASAATFSLLPGNNASGNFTKVTQYVPVKIVVDTRGVVLPLETSVEVRILVREPPSEWPLPWEP
jgi:biotin carboxyl carrier protein